MSAKMASPGLPKIKIFWDKGHDVIISVDDAINKILSRDSNYIVYVSCDQRLVTAAFIWETLLQSQFYQYLTSETAFWRDGFGSSSIIWDWH